MYIKQNKQFKYQPEFSSRYTVINPQYQYNISFLAATLDQAYIFRKNSNGELEIFDKLKFDNSIGWNDDKIIIDQQHNLVYLGVSPDFCCDEEYDDIYEEKIAGKSLLQLYQENILEHITISKTEFMYLIKKWDTYLAVKTPFLLLYQDETNKFDIMPFNSKEAMEFFVQEHTKI